MCGDSYSTMNMMMPFFDSAMDSLEDSQIEFAALGQRNEDAEAIADGTEQGYNKLLKYFEVSSDMAIAALALDPRLKIRYYEDNADSRYAVIVENIISQIASDLNLDAGIDVAPAAISTNKSFLPSSISRIRKQPAVQTTLQQYRKFSEEGLLDDHSILPLQWWRSQVGNRQYSKLSQVALAILAVPATSAVSQGLGL